MQSPQIVEKPPLTVIGLRASFIHALSPDTNNLQVIGPLWERFLHRQSEVPNRIGRATFGIIYARPEAERRHVHELAYIAAAAVSSDGEVPPGMVAYVVPAGRFAVFVHRGPIAKIAETCREIYRQWLPQSDWEHAGMADVELYDERFDCASDRSEMEYWIPLHPKRRAE